MSYHTLESWEAIRELIRAERSELDLPNRPYWAGVIADYGDILEATAGALLDVARDGHARHLERGGEALTEEQILRAVAKRAMLAWIDALCKSSG